ncbi:tRNA (uridine(54)-C5)-methyltransferase TrmA [Aggregatibacter kilianii]|uniref:tRNA (uridine(54)-C5)-methyltransferase TrmA n=1 Tax=Aggregatibacter kilianii TaxID=2025884 RepID=UPI000D657F45|nr:tRNA (uridine(54)-C5)-methyltransferase TrmA [Aggregatibacter kilianii]
MLNLPVERYPELLAEKQQKLTALLSPFHAPELQVFPSPTQHFRMRAEFRIWHEGDDFYHIMFNQQSKQRYRVDQFPIASELINRMMTALLPLLKPPVLHHKLFQIDYLSTQSQQIIVSLLYHKTLDDNWQAAAQDLRSQLQQQGFNVQIIGRASKQKICLEQDYVDEILRVHGRNYIYRQVENSFTQPNAAVNGKMLEWAVDCTCNSRGDLLELYCGNGNFSVALAQNFRKVLATEVAKPSVAAAQFNIAANNVDNLQIIRMSAEEFTQAMQGVREFNRLKGIDLTSYQCNTIFVDPPRAGLDDETLKLVQQYERILYISCNPHTLCDNLQTLSRTHRIEKAALFDQFPYTEHMESGVWLVRKS